MKGRVAVLKPGKLFELREFTIPDPEPGAAIVRMSMAGVYRPAILPSILDFLRRNCHVPALRRIVSHKFPLANIDEAFHASEWSGRDTPLIRSALIP